MKDKSYRIWILLLAGILLIGGYLYRSSVTNQENLHEEAIHRTQVVKDNFINILNTLKTNKKGRKPFKRFLDSIAKDTVALKHQLAKNFREIGKSDFFDHVVLTGKGGYVLYPDNELSLNQLNLRQYKDSTNKKLGVVAENLDISGTEYRVYQQPITYLGHSFNVLGLIKEEQFHKTARQLNFSLIYLLIILVVVVISSYPILVFLGMSEGDMLKRSLFEKSVLSLVLVIAITGFTLSYIPIDQHISKQQEEEVTSLKSPIIRTHQNFITGQIKDLNKAFGNKDSGDSIRQLFEASTRLGDSTCFCLKDTAEKGKHYNELLEVKTNGLIRGVIFKDSNDVFYNQFEHDLPLLDERPYVNQAMPHSYYLSSHFSYNTRQFEGVISRKLVTDTFSSTKSGVGLDTLFIKGSKDTGKAYFGDTSIIQAITYDFSPVHSENSLINLSRDTLLNLKYLLVNPSGGVYYSSPNINAHLKNLADGVGQKKWEKIKTLMDNNQSAGINLTVPVTLDGHDYEAYISRSSLKDSLNLQRPLWLMVFKDPKIDHYRNFAISVHGFAGILLYIGVLTIIILLYIFFGKHASTRSSQASDLFWLKPSFFKARYYLFCSGVTLIHILLFFILLVPLDNGFSFNILEQAKSNMWRVILLAGESTVFLMLIDYFLLSGLGNRLIEGKINIREMGFLLSLLLLMVFLISMASGVSGYPQSAIKGFQGLFYCQGGIVLLIIIGLYTRFLKFSKSYQRYYLVLYNSFLAITLMFVGIIVGVLAHQSAFQYERNVWCQYNQGDCYEMGASWVESCGEGSGTFLQEFDEQRRKLLTTYSPPDYPSVDSYTYAGKGALSRAFNNTGNKCSMDDKPEPERDQSGFFGFWLPRLGGLLIVIILLYYLVRALTKRLFLKNYLETPADQLLHPANYSYGIALDNKEAMQFYSDYWHNENLIKVDLASYKGWEYLEEELAQQKEVDAIILGNVHLAFNNQEHTNKLLPLIQQCKEKGIKMALIGSKPFQELKALMPGANEGNTPGEAWRLAFGDFITQIIPISYNKKLSKSDQAAYEQAPYLNRKLYQEILYGPNYEELSAMLKEDLEAGSQTLSQSQYSYYINRINAYNEAYYQEIWERLPFKEKQMVYNFATEGFVNYKNKEILRALFQKGVLKVEEEEGDIVLFNDSFADFVRNAPTDKEINDFEEHQKANGNISNIRNALLTFIFLVLLGVSLLRPELVDRYIGALSGILALVSALSSVLAKANIPIPFLKSKGFLQSGND